MNFFIKFRNISIGIGNMSMRIRKYEHENRKYEHENGENANKLKEKGIDFVTKCRKMFFFLNIFSFFFFLPYLCR